MIVPGPNRNLAIGNLDLGLACYLDDKLASWCAVGLRRVVL